MTNSSSNRLRHQWGEPNRMVYKTERVCLHPGCGLIKVTWHQGEKHWIEWWRGGARIEAKRTPACVAVEQEAHAA